MKGLILVALFGCAYAAVYQVGEEFHDFDALHTGDNQRKVETDHLIPEESETLNHVKGGKGKLGKTSRAAVPFATTGAATQKYIVDTHNQLRRVENAGDMQEMAWDNEVSAKAQAWANQCVFRHPTNGDAELKQYMSTGTFDRLGQNIAYTSGGSSWENAFNMWAGEKKDFKYDANPSGVVGHYTQIVWSKTYKVGCGYAKCSFGDYFVCNYGPGGNMSPGQYKPFTKGSGAGCDMCKAKCSNKLCTNPCGFTNGYTNCDDLFKDPKTGCKPGAFALDKCNATCKCKAQGLMY